MEVLSNGAEVLLKGTDRNDETYALCRVEHGFVTWAIDKDGNAYWGHYYPLSLGGLIDGARDFAHRTNYDRGETPPEEVTLP